ncbi:MAG: VOC family protein [Dehalococcoidia bacterium]|jgi:catechol 2,3-dioxygenase-like lactoylglutathione lyase family enzyme|nr:VOC family protein [Dehalococcoidia bacterium]
MFDKIQHIGYLVGDLDAAIGWFEKGFGGKRAAGGPMRASGMFPSGGRNAFVHFGQVEVELIEPQDRAGIAAGTLVMHHVGYVVPNIVEAKSQLEAKGFKFASEFPYTNIMKQQVLYFDSSTTNGLMLHLTQQPEQPNDIGVGEGLAIDRIVHAGYLLADLEGAIAWYVDNFEGVYIGGRTEPIGRRNAYVDFGQVQVELIETEDKSRLSPEGYAMDHVGYVVSDIATGITECLKRGLKFVADSPLTNPIGQTLLYFDTATTMGARMHLTQLPK